MIDLLCDLFRRFTDHSTRFVNWCIENTVGASCQCLALLLRERSISAHLTALLDQVLPLVVQALKASLFNLLHLVRLCHCHDTLAFIHTALSRIVKNLLLRLLQLLVCVSFRVVLLLPNLLLLSVCRLGNILLFFICHHVVLHTCLVCYFTNFLVSRNFIF